METNQPLSLSAPIGLASSMLVHLRKTHPHAQSFLCMAAVSKALNDLGVEARLVERRAQVSQHRDGLTVSAIEIDGVAVSDFGAVGWPAVAQATSSGFGSGRFLGFDPDSSPEMEPEILARYTSSNHAQIASLAQSVGAWAQQELLSDLTPAAPVRSMAGPRL
jgi:hypothetical protein